MKKLILSFLFLLPLILFAQTGVGAKVQFCETYEAETGETSGYYDSWDIKPAGGYIYIVYTQDALIKEPLLLEIQKKEDGVFTFFASRNFLNDVTSKKRYAMYDLEFKEAGTYKVIVKTKNGKFLAEATTKINVVSDEDKPASTITSDYYEDSKIQFGTSVGDNAEIKGESSSFYLKNGEVSVAILITNGKVFKTEKIKLSVYKKITKNGKEDTKLVQTIPVTGIGEDWDWVYATIDFTEKGEYIVDVWNENELFINTGYVTIK